MHLLSIDELVHEFYALEAIAAMLSSGQYNNFEPMRHSHSKWYQDFHEFRDGYINKFASIIFDYTALVVAAELRHCKDKAERYIKDYYTSADKSRQSVYFECNIYKARDILMAGRKLFDNEINEWKNGYGGYKWKKIAEAGLMKDMASDCMFIDHCVDLSHNNSIYFDKGAGIFHMQNIAEYQKFLDKKRYCDPQELISMKQGRKFDSLLARANNLNIIEVRGSDENIAALQDDTESRLFEYKPIHWGTKRLDCSDNGLDYSDSYDEYERCA